MHKPFYTWTSLFRRLGLKPKHGRKPPALRPRTLRFEPLDQRQMLSGDVQLAGFYADGNHLVVRYDVLEEDAEPFQVGVYRVAEQTGAETQVASAQVKDPGQLAPGTGHTLQVDCALAENEIDYWLVAKLEAAPMPSDSPTSSTSGLAKTNQLPGAEGQPAAPAEGYRFEGGVFLAADGTLYVHGTPGDDVVSVKANDAGTLQVRLNQVGYSYEADDLAQIRIYTHAGNDRVAAGAQVATSMWVFAGSGNDYVRSGSGDDVLAGGSGDDHLYGTTGTMSWPVARAPLPATAGATPARSAKPAATKTLTRQPPTWCSMRKAPGNRQAPAPPAPAPTSGLTPGTAPIPTAAMDCP